MKKSVKGIIGLCGVLAVLGGGYAALMLTQPADSDENSVSENPEVLAQNIVLIRDDKSENEEEQGVVKTVDVKNQTDTLHVVQKTQATEDSAATYTLDGYQDVDMLTSVIGTLANNANGLTSADLIEENCADLSKFGLESPEITVDVKYESGSEHSLSIGNKAPSGDVTYVIVDGGKDVYTVNNSTVANYSRKLIDFVDTTVIKSPDETPIIERLRIARDDIDYDILLEYNGDKDNTVFSGGTSASHIMKEPVYAYIAVEKSSDIITGMFGLYADDVYSVHCDNSDIAEAGLENPFCTVTMYCDDGECYRLLFSESFVDEDNKKSCYCMLEGGNVIYTMSAEKAKWLSVMPVDIASTMYIVSYVWSISDMKITVGDEEYAFEIAKADPEAELTSPKSSDFVVKLNGKDFDSERYRLFYSSLIKGDAENFAFEEKLPSKKPMVTVEYKDDYNRKSYKIDYYEYSNMTALIAINDECRFFISKSFVETLIENTRILETDKDFATTWK